MSLNLDIYRHIFRLYFDNLYTSHPLAVMLDVFLPFILTEEPLNTFHDAGYHRDLREFCPNPFNFVRRSLSTPTLTTLTDAWSSNLTMLPSPAWPPSAVIPHCFVHYPFRYWGNLRLFGRDVADIISEIAVLCYFPMKTLKEPLSDIDTLPYAYSNTRTTINQLRPNRLAPIIPIAPSKPFNRISEGNIEICQEIEFQNSSTEFLASK